VGSVLLLYRVLETVPLGRTFPAELRTVRTTHRNYLDLYGVQERVIVFVAVIFVTTSHISVFRAV